LFSVAGYHSWGRNHNYAVSPDDQRFVMVERIDDGLEFVPVLNFFAELSAKVGRQRGQTADCRWQTGQRLCGKLLGKVSLQTDARNAKE